MIAYQEEIIPPVRARVHSVIANANPAEAPTRMHGMIWRRPP